MIELSTAPSSIDNSQKNFTGVYIDRDGSLDTFHYLLEGSYYHDSGTKYEYDAVIKSYTNKFIVFRSFSAYNKLDEFNIDTDVFQIESHNRLIETRTAFENRWGSMRECLELSLRNEIFANIYSAHRNIPDMETRLVPYLCPENSLPLQLVIMTDTGLQIKSGILKYVFREDRTTTCPSCLQGFITFEESINKIRKHVIANTTEATFNGSFIHDFDCSSDMAITRSLYEAFRTVIELAKIESIQFEEIK